MQRTQLTRSWAGALAAALVLAAAPFALAQPSQQAITLVPNSRVEVAFTPPAGAPAYARDYREFASAKLGKSTEPELFTLQFNQATKLTALSASNDFHVSATTCIEGHFYSSGDQCSVWVVFTPTGPGHRSGKLAVSHSASVEPLIVPTGGTGYGPVVSFTPALITTVPGTYPSGTGLLNLPIGLTVDGGDNLYIADSGNNLVRYIDSSGVISTIAGGGSHAAANYLGPATSVSLSTPAAVAVDFFGDAYIADSGNNVVRAVLPTGYALPAVGSGTGSASHCSVGSPCAPTSIAISAPQGLAIDAAGNLFVNTFVSGVPWMFDDSTWGGPNPNGTPTLTNVNYQGSTGYTNNLSLGIDAYDNLYHSVYLPAASGLPQDCYIFGQNSAYSRYAGGTSWVVAGTRTCGFSGDGGLAVGAEISNLTGSFAFDAAGNFYFADANNNRVRRIDEATGIIHTIAGNGVSGYSGDGGPATSAPIARPLGIAVDSRGDVYATGFVGSSSFSHAVLRQVGPAGALSFPVQGLSTTSPVQTITVTNTGNADLNLVRVAVIIPGAIPANVLDFAIDPLTTTCLFPSTLPLGQSCYIGVAFSPQGLGARAGTISFSDNTATGLNTIQLSGTGALPAQAVFAPTTLTFPTTAVGVTSASISSSLSNPGGVPLTIGTYSFVGNNTTDFAQTHTCGATLAVGASCTVNVTFHPSASGQRSTTLVVVTSAGQANLSLIGNPGSAAVAPSTVTLASKANPVPIKQAVVLTSLVASKSSTPPTGQLELREGSKILATVTLSAGEATFKLTTLPAGTHPLTARYLGDKLHAPSQSTAINQVVAP